MRPWPIFVVRPAIAVQLVDAKPTPNFLFQNRNDCTTSSCAVESFPNTFFSLKLTRHGSNIYKTLSQACVRFWRISTHRFNIILHNPIIVDFSHCLVAKYSLTLLIHLFWPVLCCSVQFPTAWTDMMCPSLISECTLQTAVNIKCTHMY